MMSCGFGACATCAVETVDGMKGAMRSCLTPGVVVSKVNMAVDFGGVKMKNPINTASGTFWQRLAYFEQRMCPTAITTIQRPSRARRPANGEARGGMMNPVGLRTPGVAAFAAQSGPWLDELSQKGTQVICQVAGHSTEGSARLDVLRAVPVGSGLEINVSCPNIAAGGIACGSTPRVPAT